MFIAVTILGVIWLVLSLIARHANRSFIASLPASSRWLTSYKFLWLLGVLLGVASIFIAYPYTADKRYMVYGFPFLAYAFDAAGSDYAGVLTLPFMLCNFLCWFFLPHVGFWLASRMASKAGHANGA
jgi:hypothetical protein